MLNFDVKRKINTLRDILVGKVPDPKAQVEQITIALIYKFMDDMDLQGAEFGGARVFFSGDYKDYAFSQIMLPEHSAQDRLNLYAEGIDKMTNNPELPKLFRDILRNAYIPYRDPETLNRFLKEIAEFSYEDSEELGNAFEYLLSIMGSQGDAGQFRTPRHIIDMMVEITAPAKNESILDPACGTAGFLISAYNYIKKSNLDEHGKSTLVADDMTRMTKNFAGYDISPDMVRLSRVNMYLHGFTNPNISEYDTLTSLEKWDDTYDVIFSNPPFMTPKGGITPHNRYRVSAKRAEVLFVDYISEHLNPTGRAAIIVPEGIVFQSQTAYKNLRKMLVEGNYLYGVISLPAGVFNPYSGVKTSILLIDKTLAKERDSILFVKLNNDGFDLGAQRREIKGSEIPDVVNIFKDYQQGVDVAGRENVVLAKKVDIAGQDYILVGERYAKTIERSGAFPLVSLGDTSIFRIESGGTPDTKNADYWDGNICWATLIDLPPDNTITYLYDTERHITEAGLYGSSAKLLPADSILVSSRATIGRIAITRCETATNQGFKNVIITDKSRALTKYVAFMLTKLVPKMVALSAGGTFKEISKTNFSTLQIPLPPLAVQEEIVTEIESYQKIIDGARQVVENYKPTIKIDPAWETVPLGEVCVTSSGGTPKSSNREYYENGTINWLKSGEVANGYIYATEQKITEKALQESSAKVFPPETVVVAMYGATAGQVGILKIESSTNQAVCGILPNKMFEPDFLYLYLLSKHDYFVSQSTGGAQPNISQMLIRKTLVPIVPIDEQKRIVSEISIEMSIVEQNKRLIEIFQQKIKDKIAEVWGA